MYALAFETNLLFPDVEEECAGKLNPETCASLKTVLRCKFKGTRRAESAPLCQWMPCAEACVMEEPGEDEMSPMSAARRPERGPTRRDNGRAQAHELLEGGPPDAWESQAPIPEGGAADGDATGFTVSCSVQCDGAACVAPWTPGAACLSSTLDDAFAVPSRTAACLFGLDRLEDEVRARGDSSKTTVRDCAEMLAPTLARAVVARSRELRRAAAAAAPRTTARASASSTPTSSSAGASTGRARSSSPTSSASS
ncbi:hypothetical protein SO694_00050014 [Aureococcus anophagefferens]|uniref:Uncharacterized protein n=1 Tax=Aureococcus anophagefferens TaxID=44056 RepID=A0ABR1FYJ3_AURAN